MGVVVCMRLCGHGAGGRATTSHGTLVRRTHRSRRRDDIGRSTGATVTQIAAHWGFANPSRFTATYRDTYGVLPSHTLRN